MRLCSSRYKLGNRHAVSMHSEIFSTTMMLIIIKSVSATITNFKTINFFMINTKFGEVSSYNVSLLKTKTGATD